jgi:hypothetical protein
MSHIVEIKTEVRDKEAIAAACRRLSLDSSMRIIEVIVSPQGATKVQTKGFAGGECQQASKFIEAALGQRTGEQLTAEYYNQATAQQQAKENT